MQRIYLMFLLGSFHHSLRPDFIVVGVEGTYDNDDNSIIQIYCVRI